MKQIPIFLTAILLMSISSFGESSSTNVVIEIIEFDCINHIVEFDQYSKEFNTKDPLQDYSSLIAKLKSSDLPQKVILHHSQAFSVGTEQTSQSTTLDGVQFNLGIIPNDNSNLVKLKIDYSNPISEEHIESMKAQAILKPGETQILSTDFRTGEGRGEVTSRVIKIAYATIEISG